MKVALVQPPFTIFRTEVRTCHPPLGLAYIAGRLKTDHDVLILDALAEGYQNSEMINKEFIRYGLSTDSIRTRLERFIPDVVGVSCLFSTQIENANEICRIAKSIDKRIITILGGAHPSAVPEEALQDENVDFVVIGEGEDTLSKLLKCIEDKKDIQGCGIDGIGFRRNGRSVVIPKKIYKENLDELPFPHWDIFPLEAYFKINMPHGGQARNIPFLPVATSRGCPSECVFCSVHNLWGRNYRKRTVESMLKELGHLKSKFGVKEILFEDDNLTFDKTRAKEIFKGMIDENLDLSWSVPNGIAVQAVDSEMLELMKASGCHSISVGVESGDEYILKTVVKKPITLQMARDVINKAKELKLDTTAFFVVGFPGEDEAQLKKTFRFASDLRTDNTNFFFATPLPGTRLLELCREKGLVKGGLDYRNLKSDRPYFDTGRLSKRQLSSLVNHARLKLYIVSIFLNPGKFFKKLKRRIMDDPGYFLRFAIKYFGTKR